MNNSPEIDIRVIPNENIDYSLAALAQLVGRGYGFTENETKTYFSYQAKQEYEPNGRKVTFFAYDGDQPVASLVADVIDPQKDYQIFWQQLPENLAKRFGLAGPVVGVGGIVVDLEYRQQGLAKKLFTKMAEELQPSMVVGSTKNPAVVKLRWQTLAKQGFISSYGKYILSPDLSEEATKNAYVIAEAYQRERGRELHPDWVYNVPIDRLPPTLPEVSSFEKSIQLAFSPVIERQQKLGNTETAVTTLITIKESVLSHS